MAWIGRTLAWVGRTLTGLYHSGYTASQLPKPALLAEPAPPLGSFLTADVAITTPLAGWELSANSYVSLDLLKLAGAELALEAQGGTLILEPHAFFEVRAKGKGQVWETHSQTIRSDNWRDFRKKCLFQCGGPAGIRTQISGFTDRCSTVELQNHF
jgi:hypothetical protein